MEFFINFFMKSLSFMRHAESDDNYIRDRDFDKPIKKSG